MSASIISEDLDLCCSYLNLLNWCPLWPWLVCSGNSAFHDCCLNGRQCNLPKTTSLIQRRLRGFSWIYHCFLFRVKETFWQNAKHTHRWGVATNVDHRVLGLWCFCCKRFSCDFYSPSPSLWLNLCHGDLGQVDVLLHQTSCSVLFALVFGGCSSRLSCDAQTL